jgi:hypothetical protein
MIRNELGLVAAFVVLGSVAGCVVDDGEVLDDVAVVDDAADGEEDDAVVEDDADGDGDAGDELGDGVAALCHYDPVYRYIGPVEGYPTWAKRCTGKGYQVACSNAGRELQRWVGVGYDSSHGYYLDSRTIWRQTGAGCH